MKLEITLTDEQAKQLAEQIKAVAPTLESALDLPTGSFNSFVEKQTLPEPPEGFHPAMMGPLKIMAIGNQCSDVGSWLGGKFAVGWSGSDFEELYALRIGSEIARLNGLEPEDKPESRKAREFDASIGNYGRLYARDNGDKAAGFELIRVREILPGEPTQEQVQSLVDACWTWRDVPYHHGIKAALAPFRKEGK